MILSHGKFRPKIHPSARIAPNATVCGEVTIGENTSIGFGAVLAAETGPIMVGRDCVIMDTAVLRGIRNAPLKIGNCVLVGPRAYLTGCEIQDEVFIATGATVLNGARIEKGAEVRINGVVHIKTVLSANSTVPIGWIAVGDPASIVSPDSHDKIWSVQKTLNFPRYVFGVDRPAPGENFMGEVMPRYAKALGEHKNDEITS